MKDPPHTVGRIYFKPTLLSSLYFCIMIQLLLSITSFLFQFNREVPAELAQFIPDGYVALDHAYGDLNKDKRQDVLIILKNLDEEKLSVVVERPEPRPLLVIIRQKDGSLKQVTRNDKVVLCVNCGGVFGDPYAGMTIKNGFFSIEHYGGSNWRWERIITFKYSTKDKRWFLHKDGTIRYQPSNEIGGEEILTPKDFGTVEFEKFDVYKEPEE